MITLQTLQGTGIVRVQSSPPGSVFIFDGEEYGNAPVTITNVDEGEHEYVLKAEGFEDYTGKAVVKAGELCCVDVAMETGTETSKCTQAAQTPCPSVGIPNIGPGYIAVRERDLYGGLGLLVGLIVGATIVYLLLRKK